MEVVSIGPVEGSPDDFEAELARAGKTIDGRKLLIVYLPIDADHAAYLSAAARAVPEATVVGATNGGAAFTERGPTRYGVVAALFGGAEFDFQVAVARDLAQGLALSVRKAASSLADAARRRMFRSQALVTLADAFACEGDALLAELQAATPPHWHHLGATAGDDWRFEKTFVFCDGEILSNAALLIGLFSAQAPQLAVHHGWCAVEDAREFSITEISGNRLASLDDRPAAEVYAEELTRLGLIQPGDDPLRASATFELGARTMYGELKIRAPLALNADGSVTLASGLPHGTVVSVVSASVDELIAAAGELSHRVLDPLGDRRIRGALVFDCGARVQLLGDRYHEETAAFSGGRQFPMLGLAGYGEIAKFAGSVEGFHNATAVMAAW